MLKRGLLTFLILGAILVTPFASFAGNDTPTAQQHTLQMGEEAFVVAGLDGEVTIHFDEFNVPHIYATTTHDLILAQGFVHAANRWWQMEWFRHQGAGRLSELMGENLVGTDTFLRTLGLQRNAERELEIMPADTRALLDAYTEGVNAWIAGKAPGDLAIEYNFVSLLSGEIEIEPWQPLHSLLLAQALLLDQESGDLQFELFKGAITEAVGPLGALVLVPIFPYDKFPIITEPGYTPPSAAQPNFAGLSQLNKIQTVVKLPGGFGMEGVGSNSWAVSGALTDTGKPYLANDPHIGIQNPPIWFQNGLHCVEINDGCPFDVYGYSLASSPLIVIGHNQAIGWGMTNSGLDTMDIYQLELNPENPLQYMYNGEYVDMEVITETINVAGSDPIEVPVRLTNFGVVINELVGFEQPLALRWTSYDDNYTYDAFIGINSATNWEEFQAGVEKFPVGQNFIYADAEGNIGLVSGGKIPIRAEGHDGSVPVAGVDSTYEWQGYVDSANNPRIYNPEEGYIVAANNPIVRPENFETVHSTYYDLGYRAARIEELIQASDGIDMARMIEIQNDSHNPSAEFMIPILSEIAFEDEQLQAAVAILQEWDRMDEADSTGAAIYNAFWASLMPLIFDELPDVPSGDSLEVYIVSLMVASQHPLWANAELGTEDPAEIMTMALENALAMLTEKLGEDMSAWQWGDIHIAAFNHRPLGQLPAGVDVGLDIMLNDIYALFNRKVGVNGGLTAVNRMAWNAASGDFVIRDTIASMREVLDFSDFNNSKFINPMGQVGDPRSSHYDDMLPLWANGEYIPHGYTVEAVEAMTHHVWTLSGE